MPRDGALTLSDVHLTSLSIVSKPCDRFAYYNTDWLKKQNGAAKLTRVPPGRRSAEAEIRDCAGLANSRFALIAPTLIWRWRRRVGRRNIGLGRLDRLGPPNDEILRRRRNDDDGVIPVHELRLSAATASAVPMLKFVGAAFDMAVGFHASRKSRRAERRDMD
jgi:hypothetical protein